MKTKAQEIGETFAYFPSGEGSRSLWVFGELVTRKTKSEQTGGAYSLFEVASPPGGGPPSHVQHREDESFYVLEGEYEFQLEGLTWRAGAGALVYVPKGTLHAHKNVGVQTGKLLLSQTPGGLYERFSEEIGEDETKDGPTAPTSENPPDMERIIKIAAEHGIEISSSGRPCNGPGEITG